MDPALRASDADRHRVVGQLERHTAAGRLTLDEFTARVDRALTAITHGDLAAVLRDLPAEPSQAVPASTASGDVASRQLLAAFLLAALTLVLLAVLLALAR